MKVFPNGKDNKFWEYYLVILRVRLKIFSPNFYTPLFTAPNAT